jgi:putative transposase
VRKSQIFSVVERFSGKYTVSEMCEFYNVSRRGFYDFRKRQSGEDSDQELINLIAECHEKHKRRYGYRRLTLWLKQEKKLVINKKKVLRITSRNNLLSAIRRRKVTKFKSNGNLKYENVLNREFHSKIPNEKWVTDISYIIMPDGTAYLSAIRDLCGNFIVAYRTAKRQDYSLVKDTISDAMQAEEPQKSPLLHSDGGGQYRSFDYRKQTTEHGITPSMSKPSTPGDNACAENFFSIFKAECIYLEKPKTLDEALNLTDEFVHYYNYERIQGNGLTPYEERQMAFVKQKADI